MLFPSDRFGRYVIDKRPALCVRPCSIVNAMPVHVRPQLLDRNLCSKFSFDGRTAVRRKTPGPDPLIYGLRCYPQLHGQVGLSTRQPARFFDGSLFAHAAIKATLYS